MQGESMNIKPDGAVLLVSERSREKLQIWTICGRCAILDLERVLQGREQLRVIRANERS
jgi:hypothetical protein